VLLYLRSSVSCETMQAKRSLSSVLESNMITFHHTVFALVCALTEVPVPDTPMTTRLRLKVAAHFCKVCTSPIYQGFSYTNQLLQTCFLNGPVKQVPNLSRLTAFGTR
jgi:hypothetical protein